MLRREPRSAFRSRSGCDRWPGRHRSRSRCDLGVGFITTTSSRGISGTNTNLPSGTVAGEPARTLFATKSQLAPGTLTSGWARQSSSSQGVAAGKMVSLANYFAFVNGDLVTARTSTANSPKGLVQNKSDVNSYASYQPGGTTNSRHRVCVLQSVGRWNARPAARTPQAQSGSRCSGGNSSPSWSAPSPSVVRVWSRSHRPVPLPHR